MARIFDTLREALRGGERDYTKGSIRRAIVLLSIPMVIEMGMESLFSLADVYFVSRLGSQAVAAIGLTEALMIVVYATGFGLGIPATAMISRRIGEGDREDAARVGVQAVALGLCVAAVIGVSGVLFAPQLLGLMGAEDAVVEIGTGYITLQLAASVTVLMLFLNGAVLRGAGDASSAMRALVLANGINLVLDPCLIFGLGPFPELGLFGAAVATTIGRSVGVLYQLRVLFRGTGNIRVRPRHLSLQWPLIRTLLRLSIGAVGQNVVETASWVLLARIVAIFGSTALAGYTVTIRVLVFFLLPGWGIANAAATLVGQNLGAGDPERAASSAWLAGLYNMVFLAGFAVVFHLFAEWFVGPFSSDPEVLTIAAEGLRIVGYGCVFYAWGMVLFQAFNGAGDTMTPLYLNVICFWLVKLPLAYVLATFYEETTNGVWIAVTLAYSLSAALSLWLFRRGRWKRRAV